jgi:hypothetical protein
MLYGGLSARMARRFQHQFDEIVAHHNFDYGAEFEIAICEVLRTILPQRASVCRGYVVGADGQKGGDDIIVYDAAEFPTLRGLGSSLALREEVPAEAVLAYIEAKHTLRVGASDAKSKGQSLQKALQQCDNVKRVPRAAVATGAEIGGIDLSTHFQWTPRDDLPQRMNPYYTAIWGRKLDHEDKPDPAHKVLQKAILEEYDNVKALPDLVAAGNSVAIWGLLDRDESGQPRPPLRLLPFHCSAAELITVQVNDTALGTAMFHLLYAIEKIKLGKMPWDRLLSENLAGLPKSYTMPPIRKPEL